jgi:hypothetical protein
VVTCTVRGYQCALDVAVPLGMHCLEVKLGHYAVEEVPDGPISVDGRAGTIRTVATAACRPRRAGATTQMAVPHDYVGVLVECLVVVLFDPEFGLDLDLESA